MAKFTISGETKLQGSINVAGNKNSVLAIMAACLLTEEQSILENVPNISDVKIMAELLEMVGAKISGVGSPTLTIDTKDIHSAHFPSSLTQKLRASVLLIGPMVARVGKVKLGYPGGDIIGRRPLDTHFQVMTSLGSHIKESTGSFEVVAPKLKSAEIFLQEASVTATENAITAASAIEDLTTIRRAASEPHVVDLCEFLVKMGVAIDGIGTNVLQIKGTKKRQGASHSIRPDHIEVGTFAIMAAVTQSELTISPIVKEDLDMILLTLRKFNVDFDLTPEALVVHPSKLKAVEKVVTDVWPGFATDLMAPTIVLATQSEGVTILHDWMYESRMFFVDKLLSMGAKVEIADPHRVFVYGPSKLHAQKLDTPDIRAGMALVIAALAAKGKSEIAKAELIERGYENIVERLSALGAKIKEFHN